MDTKRGNAIELFVLSALSLFIELLVIRWMSADIRAFTVFRTFPLVTCFVGLGVGFSLGKSDNYRYLALALLAFGGMMKLCDMLGLGLMSFPSLSTFQWNNLAVLFSMNAVFLITFLLAVILVLAIPFAVCVCMASRMGVIFDSLETLPAYGLNIFGALTGGLLFSAVSNAGVPPWQLLMVGIVVVLALQWKEYRTGALVCIAALVLLPLNFIFLPSFAPKLLEPALLTFHSATRETIWSPYQRIDLTVLQTAGDENPDKKPEFVGLELSANRAFYQYFFNLNANSPLRKTILWDSITKDYDLPFTFNTPKSALIVGAGTGQNVSAALKSGIAKVDAVEIDPAIIAVGRRYNPDYAKPSVNLVCDDARHFFSGTKEKYDVIDFSTLDSHTIAGLGSSVRIDAYVYTKESIREALSLLKDDGVVVISFVAVAPWTAARLYQTFSEAAGYSPMVLEGKMIGKIFVLGNGIKSGALKPPAGYKVLQLSPSSGTRVLTDDWPYLYVQPDIVDYPYLLVVAQILALALYAGRRFLFSKASGTEWQLFFMGAAFMLLELHAISFLSLLYGSTWVTSAIVINAILLMILGATFITHKASAAVDSKQKLVFLGLFVSIAVSFAIQRFHLAETLSGGQFLGYVALTLITVLPMGIAGVIFASALRTGGNASKGLAFNLFGAVVGGLLEYISNYTGIANLLLVASGLYMGAFLCSLRGSKSDH